METKITKGEVKKCLGFVSKLKNEIAKAVIGQDKVVNGLMKGILCNGHVLLEGVPGIGKTLVIKSLGQASGCSVERVQFTVDLLPTDILGIISYSPKKGFETIKGPIFGNFIIADEINRAPPKTQSALIEAMQERQVTLGRNKYILKSPFFVMATKNPLEQAGVYNLPEAQKDRFLFNLKMGFPKSDDEKNIMKSNLSIRKFEDFNLRSVISPKDIIFMQKAVKRVYLDDAVASYILSIVHKTRDINFKFHDCILFGGVSPRASISLYLASKATALLNGREYVIPEDVRDVVHDVLRHRLATSYKAKIRNLDTDKIIDAILNESSVV